MEINPDEIEMLITKMEALEQRLVALEMIAANPVITANKDYTITPATEEKIKWRRYSEVFKIPEKFDEYQYQQKEQQQQQQQQYSAEKLQKQVLEEYREAVKKYLKCYYNTNQKRKETNYASTKTQ